MTNRESGVGGRWRSILVGNETEYKLGCAWGTGRKDSHYSFKLCLWSVCSGCLLKAGLGAQNASMNNTESSRKFIPHAHSILTWGQNKHSDALNCALEDDKCMGKVKLRQHSDQHKAGQGAQDAFAAGWPKQALWKKTWTQTRRGVSQTEGKPSPARPVWGESQRVKSELNKRQVLEVMEQTSCSTLPVTDIDRC